MYHMRQSWSASANWVSNKKKASRLEKGEMNFLGFLEIRAKYSSAILPVILSAHDLRDARGSKNARKSCRMFGFNERRDKWL